MAFAYEQRSVGTRLRAASEGVPRGQVTEIQRSRMIAAAVEAVEDVGYARMTVAQVIARARVSRKTFYDVFCDREDCFLAAFDEAIAHARTVARNAFERESDWRDGVRAALAGVLVLMDDEPALARLCIVEALGAGERVLERRSAEIAKLVAVIDEGRTASPVSRQPPQVTAEGVVGAVLAVLHARLLDGNTEPLSDLLGSLMSMIVLPYLGAHAADQELARPPLVRKRERRPSRVRPTDPLAGLNMRLTYRTVRVLMVIAEHPGASNRQIAERSGIVDQGQISKLLTRLCRLRLIENFGEGQEKGASNAWHLTARGAQVEHAARPY